MIRVYTEGLIDDNEVGKATPVDVGYEITFFNGKNKHLLILEKDYVDIFSLNHDGTATYLGNAETHTWKDETLIRFEVFNQHFKAFFQVNTKNLESRRTDNYQGGVLAA